MCHSNIFRLSKTYTLLIRKTEKAEQQTRSTRGKPGHFLVRWQTERSLYVTPVRRQISKTDRKTEPWKFTKTVKVKMTTLQPNAAPAGAPGLWSSRSAIKKGLMLQVQAAQWEAPQIKLRTYWKQVHESQCRNKKSKAIWILQKDYNSTKITPYQALKSLLVKMIN